MIGFLLLLFHVLDRHSLLVLTIALIIALVLGFSLMMQMASSNCSALKSRVVAPRAISAASCPAIRISSSRTCRPRRAWRAPAQKAGAALRASRQANGSNVSR